MTRVKVSIGRDGDGGDGSGGSDCCCKVIFLFLHRGGGGGGDDPLSRDPTYTEQLRGIITRRPPSATQSTQPRAMNYDSPVGGCRTGG